MKPLYKDTFQGTSWVARYAVIKTLLPQDCSIIELGSGYGELQNYLKGVYKEYVKVDKFDFEDTIVADFNKEQYPIFNKKFDYIICSGILEYLFDPETFLTNIKKYGDTCILSYYYSARQLVYGSNHLAPFELEEFISRAGWEIQKRKNCPNINQIIYLLKQHG